jgi:cytochrome o ubiquinol oxidase operon protein cyoD
MSASSTLSPTADNHSHSHHGHDGHSEGSPHGSLKSYTTGFLLSVVLTAIPFYLVMAKVFDKSSTTALVVLAIAAIQIVVHMVYFLHMNTKAEGGWSMLALTFTSVLVVIMLSGSIWVLYHLDHNMMPGMMTDPTREIPPAHDLPGTPATSNGPGASSMPAMEGMLPSK